MLLRISIANVEIIRKNKNISGKILYISVESAGNVLYDSYLMRNQKGIGSLGLAANSGGICWFCI